MLRNCTFRIVYIYNDSMFRKIGDVYGIYVHIKYE